MGTPPTTPLQVETTGTIPGEGFRIEKLVISGRPGLPIAAHLYLPDPPRINMPAMVICSSHHNPKYQGELQDMGMTWARAGTVVLVPENLGHGERRQQPFGMREDYHGRYTIGVQLQLVGQSLIGWMVADLQRCLDVLLARPDVDANRIILMGAVAAGGDPAAIATALDPRVTCSIPFNFGAGSQVQWPGIPPFYRWDGYGDWESTRCLRNSGRDLFFPWVIVASAAPRRQIFAKEFQADAANDPAYKRLQGIYESYGAGDRIAEIHGFGSGSVLPPGASHCNNVGPYHRKQLYPLLQKWLDMPIPEEYQHRLQPEDLTCMTPQAEEKFGVRLVHEVAKDIASRQLAQARKALAELSPAQRRQKLRRDWANLLGDIEPQIPAVRRFGLASGTTAWPTAMTICSAVVEIARPADFQVDKVLLTVAPRIDVPVLMLLPSQPAQAPARPAWHRRRNSTLKPLPPAIGIRHATRRLRSSELTTHHSALRTQDSERGTQESGLSTHSPPRSHLHRPAGQVRVSRPPCRRDRPTPLAGHSCLPARPPRHGRDIARPRTRLLGGDHTDLHRKP